MPDPATLHALWLFDDDPAYYATIMAECGCDSQDIIRTWGEAALTADVFAEVQRAKRRQSEEGR